MMGAGWTGEKAESASGRDDLTAIKGIGPARQEWLRESLNVRTYQDLSVLSADEIETRLKAEGKAVSRNEIDGWLAQAQGLATAAADPALPHAAASANPEPRGNTNAPAGEGEWKPFASFVVEFQARQIDGQPRERRTVVHHIEADQGETWPGIACERLCQWMLDQWGEKAEQAPERAKPSPPARAAAAPPVSAPSANFQVTQVWAFQPPQATTSACACKAGQIFQGSVRGSEPLAFEASLALTGPGAADVARERRAYRARFYARRLPTGTLIHLGDTRLGTLVEDRLAYTVRLPETSLPPGIYHLQVVAELRGQPPLLGYLEVPVLQVS
jgi:hypothetical protein